MSIKPWKFSDRLSEVEAEIEQVKGKMSYLKDRAASFYYHP